MKVAKDRVSITDTASYATALEGGAKGGGFAPHSGGKAWGKNKKGKTGTNRVLKPRPYLSAALSELEPEIDAKLRSQLDNILKQKQTIKL